jgi:hypothetical protein
MAAAALACACTGETPVPPIDCEMVLLLISPCFYPSGRTWVSAQGHTYKEIEVEAGGFLRIGSVPLGGSLHN